MTEDTKRKANEVADALHARGHEAPAETLRTAATAERVEGAFLRGLRDACQTVLTAIEAIDPVSATMIDELRLEVDKRLIQHRE